MGNPYVVDLDQVQIGKETTFGTAVAGSAKLGLIDKCEISPEIAVTSLPDKRASLAGSFVQTLDSQKGVADISGTPSYEDIQYWLDSILGISAPSGAGPYVYADVAPLTTVPTRRMMTVIHGQTGTIDKLAGGVVNELTLSGESNKPWKFNAKLFGKIPSTGASLASLSDRTQTPIHNNVTSLFIDAWGGTIGATAITATWYSWELAIKANAALMPGIGSLTPVNYRDAAYDATLKLHLEITSATAAYLSSILGSAVLQHQVRISATTGASAIAQLNFAGTHAKSPKLTTDKDGVKTYEFELSRTYNSTLANWLTTSITNSVAALP